MKRLFFFVNNLFINNLINNNYFFFICQYNDLSNKTLFDLKLTLQKEDLKIKYITNKIISKLLNQYFNTNISKNLFNGPVCLIYTTKPINLNTLSHYNYLFSSISNSFILLGLFYNNKFYDISNVQKVLTKISLLKFKNIYGITNIVHPTLYLK